MRYGFVVPWADADEVGDLAATAEEAGWDGLFVWEPVWGVDAWVALAAAAMRTTRIRLGTMLTPLPRRRPWDLAGQTAAVDNLSGGRVILSVGLGAVHEGWLAFEADPGRRTRAELLDEGLAVLTGLWAGQPFEFTGTHYRVRPTDFMVPPPPVQRPRIPVWVVGAWPAARSMRRAARWDGWLPNTVPAEPGGPQQPITPETLRAGVAEIARLRAAEGLDMTAYDVVVEGTTTPQTMPAEVDRWRAAGATWYIEADWSVPRERVLEYARQRLAAGPARPHGE
jgi:alkanesulfonate monooxygenase SsuD/methylene tetrahydromethanopterin reductase-like flavin-dependent oxidoreductase (luciferase family)